MSSMHGEFRDLLNELCLTEKNCGTCSEGKCLVGHSKWVNRECMNLKPPHLEGADSTRPHMDMKGGYDEDVILRILAKTLLYCKACKENHTEDCVLAVIRNNIGLLEFTEEIPYEGNPVSYLLRAGIQNEVKGAALSEIYNEEKNKL